MIYYKKPNVNVNKTWFNIIIKVCINYKELEIPILHKLLCIKIYTKEIHGFKYIYIFKNNKVNLLIHNTLKWKWMIIIFIKLYS